ncbi:MAG TPA: DCC1-like thiol-disulfide oxidoreductase family protein [Cellvibrio sp.]|nr:DCC1-like thiol-disulfide oxidoreductase family protein [Cellvibrio sp.]
MQQPPHIEPGEKLVLFDGVCRLCAGWSHFLLRHDTQEIFKLCTMQSKEGQAILAYFSLPLNNYETMIYVEDGLIYDRSTAFIKIVSQLPWPYRIGMILYGVPRVARDWLYDRIALNRYRLFGKYSTCLLPTEKYLSRFIHKENL